MSPREQPNHFIFGSVNYISTCWSDFGSIIAWSKAPPIVSSHFTMVILSMRYNFPCSILLYSCHNFPRPQNNSPFNSHWHPNMDIWFYNHFAWFSLFSPLSQYTKLESWRVLLVKLCPPLVVVILVFSTEKINLNQHKY